MKTEKDVDCIDCKFGFEPDIHQKKIPFWNESERKKNDKNFLVQKKKHGSEEES